MLNAACSRSVEVLLQRKQKRRLVLKEWNVLTKDRKLATIFFLVYHIKLLIWYFVITMCTEITNKNMIPSNFHYLRYI